MAKPPQIDGRFTVDDVAVAEFSHVGVLNPKTPGDAAEVRAAVLDRLQENSAKQGAAP